MGLVNIIDTPTSPIFGPLVILPLHQPELPLLVYKISPLDPKTQKGSISGQVRRLAVLENQVIPLHHNLINPETLLNIIFQDTATLHYQVKVSVS